MKAIDGTKVRTPKLTELMVPLPREIALRILMFEQLGLTGEVLLTFNQGGVRSWKIGEFGKPEGKDTRTKEERT